MPASTGVRVFGTAGQLHAKSGRLLGYLVSHSETSSQAVTFYDSTSAGGTVLHKVNVAPEQCPFYVRFSGQGEAIPFATGLTVDPGNCDVLVWAAS
jgi:hypothetical protein